MRKFAYVALGGVAGVVLLKFLLGMILPVVGVMFGLFAWALKIAVLGAVLWLLWNFVKKRKGEADCC